MWWNSHVEQGRCLGSRGSSAFVRAANGEEEGPAGLEVPFLHFSEEAIALPALLDRGFVGGVIGKIAVVLFPESLRYLRRASGFRRVLFCEGGELALVHLGDG